MSILTNFLKLVKPEKNDYVDVEEHISNNLDKIDEKMENFNLNKLDKGGYTGTAQNLLTEISKIASKTVLGRMIVGKGLTVDSSGRTSVVSKNDAIIVNDNDIQLNTYSGLDSDSTSRPLAANQGKILNNNKLNKSGGIMTGTLEVPLIKLNKGGSQNRIVDENDKNLMRTGIDEINYLILGDKAYNVMLEVSESTGAEVRVGGTSRYKLYHEGNNPSLITYKPIGNTSTNTDLLEWLKTADSGFYCSITGSNKFTNLPNIPNGYAAPSVFFLEVKVLTVSGYKFINATYTNRDNPQVQYSTFLTNYTSWYTELSWNAIISEKGLLYRGVLGVSGRYLTYIQEVGRKNAGGVYLDLTTGKPYRCIKDTEDISVTSNFKSMNLYDSSYCATYNNMVQLYDNGGTYTNQRGKTLTLSNSLDNYQSIVIEFAKVGGGDNVQIREFYTQLLRYSDSTTLDTKSEYMIEEYNYVMEFVFRSNKTQIYVINSSSSEIKGYYCITKVYGVRR